jgi:hypothetical protein
MDDCRLKRLARSLVLGLVALAAIALTPADACAGSTEQDAIKSFYAVLLNGMKGGAALGDKGRYDALLPEIQHDFDLPYMSRMAVGAGIQRAWFTRKTLGGVGSPTNSGRLSAQEKQRRKRYGSTREADDAGAEIPRLLHAERRAALRKPRRARRERV